jgi:hypothetical protein
MTEPADFPSHGLSCRCRRCGRTYVIRLDRKAHPLTCPACPAWTFDADLGENGPAMRHNAFMGDERPADVRIGLPERLEAQTGAEAVS